MDLLCSMAAFMAAFSHIVAADIALRPRDIIYEFWPVILIGVIIIATVVLVRIFNKRKKK